MQNSKGNIFNKGNAKATVLALLMVLAFSASGYLFNGCDKDTSTPDVKTGLTIYGVSLPSSLEVRPDGDITLTGKGFALKDIIRLTSMSAGGAEYESVVSEVTEQSVTFPLPGGISSGTYRMTVVRGAESLSLGSMLLNVVAINDIPNVEGMTVKGVVYCDGVGVPNVTVSDGYEVTSTDDKGIYYLASQKLNNYVFISVPGNYEVANANNIPQFFKRLAGGNTVEQKDFSLIHTDNSNHVVIAMADWHLADRIDDLAQFNNDFLPDVNATIDKYLADGKKVYGLTLGDMSWDLYWYANHFALPEYLVQMQKIHCPVFNLMGNHDNDPYCVGDWLSEMVFKENVGPNYYSFNLGDVHYVVLDDIEYLNTGASQGVVGSRNYNDRIVTDQLEWLKRDLAVVSDKQTPIVIGMHAPLFGIPSLDVDGNQEDRLSLNNGVLLQSTLQGFTNVHFLTGHTHVNFSVGEPESIMEHNTAAVCATWWWTGKNGYAGNHICKDGSPGGYGVWEMDGSDLKWYYKSMGYPKEYQFRSYDLNQVQITAAKFAPNSTEAALAQYAGSYATVNSNNEVLINVWGYDSSWKVQVKENGSELEVTRVEMKDPLHIISYEAKRLNVGATPTNSFVTDNTAHFFKVRASSPTSTLNITVTDRFGNVFSETMTRPKELSCLMK